MCQPDTIRTSSSSVTTKTTVGTTSLSSANTPSSSTTSSSSSTTTFFSKLRLWPLPLWLIPCLYAMLPHGCFFNRGYTQWFHWTALAFVLSQSEFLCKCLVVQGTGVTLGWYAALWNDYQLHGRFAHILYWNMPTVMKQHMVEGDTGPLHPTTMGLAMRILSHTLDTAGHPVLAYVFWRRHCAQHNQQQQQIQNGDNNPSPLSTLLTWPVIVATYVLSRIWSIVHVYYNQNRFGMFYSGYDVYIIRDTDSWSSAYIAEAIFYSMILFYKMYLQKDNKTTTTTTRTKQL